MYQEINVGSVADIPALFQAFAVSAGWTGGAPSGVNYPITRPGGGMTFNVGHAISGTNNMYKQVHVTRADDGTKFCVIHSPRLNGSNNNPFVPAPTKIHCFGGEESEPFLAMVIEFGYNLYRHIYVGNVEKIGAYTGGECIAASNFSDTQSSIGFQLNWLDHVQYPFSSFQNYTAHESAGGVSIIHADNPTYPWRMFKVNAGLYAQDSVDERQVMGGFRDAFNDFILARGKSSFAGAAIIVPINLFAVRGSGSSGKYVPIGRPAGVRLVRMDGIDPGQTIEVGNNLWRCFPIIRKSEAGHVDRGTYWNATETSYIIGHAYLESDL